MTSNDQKQHSIEKPFFTVRGYQLLEQHKGSLTPCLEDYLEMICRYLKQNRHIRIKDLAELLHVRPSSASKMIHKLSELGLIDYEKYGVIELSAQGQEIGAYLLWRHDTIDSFFRFISPQDQSNSFMETELVEHILSKNTMLQIEKLMRFFSDHPEDKEQFYRY